MGTEAALWSTSATPDNGDNNLEMKQLRTELVFYKVAYNKLEQEKNSTKTSIPEAVTGKALQCKDEEFKKVITQNENNKKALLKLQSDYQDLQIKLDQKELEKSGLRDQLATTKESIRYYKNESELAIEEILQKEKTILNLRNVNKKLKRKVYDLESELEKLTKDNRKFVRSSNAIMKLGKKVLNTTTSSDDENEVNSEEIADAELQSATVNRPVQEIDIVENEMDCAVTRTTDIVSRQATDSISTRRRPTRRRQRKLRIMKWGPQYHAANTSSEAPTFSCICGRVLSNNCKLSQHIQLYSLKKPKFICPTCDKGYVAEDRLRRHERDAHKKKQKPVTPRKVGMAKPING